MDVPQAQLDPWHTWTLELLRTLGPLSYLAQLDPWAPSLDPLAHLDQQPLGLMGLWAHGTDLWTLWHT